MLIQNFLHDSDSHSSISSSKKDKTQTPSHPWTIQGPLISPHFIPSISIPYSPSSSLNYELQKNTTENITKNLLSSLYSCFAEEPFLNPLRPQPF